MKNKLFLTLFIIALIGRPFPSFAFPKLPDQIDDDTNSYQIIDNLEENTSNFVKINHPSKKRDPFPFQTATNCHVVGTALDSLGKKLAVSVFCVLPSAEVGPYDATGYFQLTIVDLKNNQQLVTLMHGQRFCFSPGGNAIVYQEGESNIEGTKPPPGCNFGLYIYNFQNQKKTEIDHVGVWTSHLNWSEHDGNIYFSNNHDFVRYDVAKGKSQIMPELRGIDFSPNGQYYIGIKKMGLIYRTADNQPVEEFNRQLPLLNATCAEFMSWLDRGKKLLVYCCNHRYHVFDLKTRSVTQDVKGHVLGTNPGQTKLLIYPGATDKKGRFIIDVGKGDSHLFTV